MALIDYLTDDQIKEMALENAQNICIFTDKNGEPAGNFCTWYYRIEIDSPTGSHSDSITVEDGCGWARFCNCDECTDFGVEKYEYFSIVQALRWVKARRPHIRIQLWVGSSRFYSDHRDGLASYEHLYQCPFLRTLGKDLNRLLSTLDVTVKTETLSMKEAA